MPLGEKENWILDFVKGEALLRSVNKNITQTSLKYVL